jgi:hypothetical protein
MPGADCTYPSLLSTGADWKHFQDTLSWVMMNCGIHQRWLQSPVNNPQPRLDVPHGLNAAHEAPLAPAVRGAGELAPEVFFFSVRGMAYSSGSSSSLSER